MLALIRDILTDIAILVYIAYLLTKLKIVKDFVSSDDNSLCKKAIMSVVFGVVGIVATYLGIPVHGAIANARVVGVLAGGIIGGPFVGTAAGLIAGIHRYAIDAGGFTAAACAISTVAAGLIGDLCARKIKRMKNQWFFIGLLTVVVEMIHMGIVLWLAAPFDKAFELIKIIAMPMITLNAIGLVLFIRVFESVFIEQDRLAADRIRLVLNIADESLPYLRKGLSSVNDLNQVIQLVVNKSGVSGGFITDRVSVLSYAGYSDLEKEFPPIARLVLSSAKVEKEKNIVCAPLIQRENEVIGTLALKTCKSKRLLEIECEFVQGLAKLFSTQLELAQLENQKKLLKKAELAALQSQINPHFLFNALSTITMFCREKPNRARELLLELSNYFRNTLNTNGDRIDIYDEMRHVHAYLELEKARFEDKLKIVEKIPEGLSCMLPSLILQPLVENAVKHGCIKNGGGKIMIEATENEIDTLITISDDGVGIPDEVINQLMSNNIKSGSVGLNNVHQRLKSTYGEEYGLRIKTQRKGTLVTVRIPNMSRGQGGIV